MQTNSQVSSNNYSLATGPAAVRRLHMLHDIYAPAGRRALMHAGLTPGMKVADFGCGVGATTRMLAEIVGTSGSVTGIDADAAQVEQARAWCDRNGLTNTSFVAASAYNTGLPRGYFSAVYCRFLLLHLNDPAACLREMRDLLKPGGLLFIEDGDLKSATSFPPSALDAFSDLFCRLGPIRGVDFRVANNLFHLIKASGFRSIDMEIHQPALIHGENRQFLQWSVEEAGPAFVKEGLISQEGLTATLREMQRAADNPDVVVLAPRMSLVWARKPLS